LARFLENKLRLMVWYRPPNAGSLVFGAQITQQELIQNLAPLLLSPDLHRGTDAAGSIPFSPRIASRCWMIVETGCSFLVLASPLTGNTSFVATEIGEALCLHWEAAALPSWTHNRSTLGFHIATHLGFVVLTSGCGHPSGRLAYGG
jgi:hypothetical protein